MAVDWDLIPHGAPMNDHAHPSRKWARKPGVAPRSRPLPGPRWRPYAEYDPSVQFIRAADPAWPWVRGATHHYRGFHGGLGDSLHSALWPAAAVYAFPGAAGTPVVDQVLF